MAENKPIALEAGTDSSSSINNSSSSTGSAELPNKTIELHQSDTVMSGVDSSGSTDSSANNGKPGTLRAAKQNANATEGESETEGESDTTKTFTPGEKILEVQRILRWPEWAYYEFLDISPQATKQDIKKAFREKSKLVHPDQNADTDATEVFQRVHKAYDLLCDDKKRKGYDQQRGVLVSDGKLVMGEFNETFAESAYESGDDSDDEPEDSPEISPEKEAILQKMTPFAQLALTSGSKAAMRQLKALNEEIFAQNVKEGNHATLHIVPINLIERNGKSYKALIKASKGKVKNEEDVLRVKNAEKDLRLLREQTDVALKDSLLPPSWVFNIPPERKDLKLSGFGEKSRTKNDSQGHNQNTQNPSGTQERPQTNNNSQGQDGTRQNPPNSSYGTEAGPMEVDPKPTHEWQPGETTRGEKILGYRPIQRQFQEMGTKRWVVTETSNMFVIERKGENNPIAVTTRDRVGEKAAEAYEALPDSQRCSLTNCALNYTRRDGSSITEILGYDREPQLTPSGNLPHTIFLVQYGEEKRLLNRSALCKAKGYKSACTMIEDFIDSIGHPPEESREDRLTVKALQVDSQINILRTRHTRQLTGRGASVHPLYSNADDGRPRMRLGETRTQVLNSKNEIDDQTIRLMGMMTSTIIDALMEKLPQLHISPANR